MRKLMSIWGYSLLVVVALPLSALADNGSGEEGDPGLLKRFLEFTTEEKDLGKDRILSPIVAPFYAPESGVGLAVGGLLTKSTDPSNPDLPRSYVKFFGLAASEDVLGIRIVSETFWDNDNIRFNPDMSIRTKTADYYGVGYENGENVDDGSGTTEYTEDSFFFTPVLLYRASGDFFIGARYDINWISTDDEAALILEDPDFQRFGDKFKLGCKSLPQADRCPQPTDCHAPSE